VLSPGGTCGHYRAWDNRLVTSGTTEYREVLRFEDCELSKAERLLLRNGHAVPLQARPFDLLAYLVDNRDRVISRDEILHNVWRGVRVNEEAVRFSVHAIRRAIGDSGHSQRIIRTVRGNGLQFVAAVTKHSRSISHQFGGHPKQIDASFLGREPVMRSLERALTEAASGSLRTVLVTGEAGAGKTTALVRAATLASGMGFRVSSARCVGTDEAPALWPWTQVLRRLLEGEAESWLAETLRGGAEAIAWILPELQEFVPRSMRSPTSDSRVSQYRLLESIQSSMRNLSSGGPLAILIDDLHEADQASLLVFGHLAAELAQSRVLLFGTFRAHGGLYQKCEAMVSTVLRLRGSQLLTISGLSEGDISIIAETHSGTRPSASAVKSILDKTNGNPFFVLQILRVLENEGRLDALSSEQPIEYSIPRGVRDAIKRQTDVLPQSVRALLAVAAVIENEFALSLLERALGMGSAEILEEITIAMDSGILIANEEGGLYRFAHALVREAIGASLTPAERAENNGRVAIGLEQMAGAAAGSFAADIARHYAAAAPTPISVRAIGWLISAARWDSDRAAFDSAAAHLERAMDLLERLAADDVELRCELCLERGIAYGLAGRREESRGALKDAYRLAARCDRPEIAARAALLFAPDLLAIETGVYDPDLVQLLEGALRLLPGGAPERCRILARLAVALHWSDEPRERLAGLIRDAISSADSSPDSGAASFVRAAGNLALYSVESPHESIRRSKSASDEDDSTALLRTILRITALWQVGRMREVDIEIEGFGSLLQSARRRSASWYMGMLRSTMALMKGQYESARELGEGFLRDGLAVDDRNALHSFALQRALAAIDVGGLEEIEPAVVGMASSFPRVEGWNAGVCYLYCELGKLEEARTIMESATGRGVLCSFPRNSWFGTLASLTLACRVLDAPDTARKLYLLWQQFSGQMAVVGFSSYCWGATDRFLGVLGGLLSDWDCSDQHFRRAMDSNRAAGAVSALAHTYADHASMLDRRHAGSGRESWDLALHQARVLGMRNLESRILREAF
jgi:DNA-binding winged helix-turn-helix (wHTH) protein